MTHIPSHLLNRVVSLSPAAILAARDDEMRKQGAVAMGKMLMAKAKNKWEQVMDDVDIESEVMDVEGGTLKPWEGKG